MHNITQWVEALSVPDSPPILLENCGDNGPKGWSKPPLHSDSPVWSPEKECGFQMYRISSDVAPQFYSTMYNLQAMIPYQDVSRPGCWSYPGRSTVHY
jgi:hypothetical protein